MISPSRLSKAGRTSVNGSPEEVLPGRRRILKGDHGQDTTALSRASARVAEGRTIRSRRCRTTGTAGAGSRTIAPKAIPLEHSSTCGACSGKRMIFAPEISLMDLQQRCGVWPERSLRPR